MLPGPGTELQYPVRLAQYSGLVLDHEDCIASIPQPEQDAEKPLHVPGMQADRGLVEDVQGVYQSTPETARQADALHSTRQRPGLAIQREIPEADGGHELQAVGQLARDGLRDARIEWRQYEPGKPLPQLVYRESGCRCDTEAAHLDVQGLGLQACAVTPVTRPGQLVLPEEHPDVLLVSLPLTRSQERDHADEIRRAVYELVAKRLRQGAPGNGRIQAPPRRQFEAEIPAASR